jgi:hypothetical protein
MRRLPLLPAAICGALAGTLALPVCAFADPTPDPSSSVTVTGEGGGGVSAVNK